ncbi:putative 2-hydroxyacid dehydrogenase UNK4.10 [Pseudocercospora fuligena]|uniref:Putative 2-hydroxyacid dehydrogenase UNK4.10 n=1 Tax=Pseudocercospora fuligena TaxID=685502 RepID=A0A8H6RM64_9PEZI|nr:putative 2-hydroxyacid dehydrogenase UNK4.10 [Pseudocercospora fuligena]
MGEADYRPIVLHIGEAIKYNHDYYEKEFSSRFRIIQNDKLTRKDFIAALRNHDFGNFSAIFRPHFQSGGEMGQWDDELISLLPPSVRIFASAGAGYNWADIDALGRRGILYCNGAGASDDAVSDTALWMILSVFRNFTMSQLAARTADPARFTEAHKKIATISANPKGKVLGIVGLGNISLRLVGKAKAIGMRVRYFDVRRRSVEEEKELGIEYLGFGELLAQSDCISLHVPLNSHTRHLINSESLAKMKPGARIINTSRGEVIGESALIEALKTGHIGAAGLDVHYNEPQVSPELAQMENVTLTTHVGGGALDTRINFELNAMKNIVEVLEGRQPLTPVNADVVREAMKQA